MTTNDGQPAIEHRQRRRQELTDLVQTLTLRMRALWNPVEFSEVELTMPQFRALDLLVNEPLRMSDIASALGISVQATTSLIDRLVDKGLVERTHDTVDRRVVICRLTPSGLTEMDRFYRMGQAHLDILVDLLTDAELDTVISAYETLAEAALRRQQNGSSRAADPAATSQQLNTKETVLS